MASTEEDQLGPLAELPFPPISKSQILHCSYHDWYPRYRKLAPKARLVPLPDAFIDYLKADGIILPPEDGAVDWNDHDSGVFSSAEADDDESDQDEDPSSAWRTTHEAVSAAITELGGSVAPKLNWSAPKDSTWINATNSMDCRSANDIYMMLKSSDFVTHDLDHAFDGCSDPQASATVPYHLVLRKYVNFNPSVEFRCFVRRRNVIGICQRDLNHYDFLFKMKDNLRERILEFYNQELRDSFPDENYAFDVYLPAPHRRVWLIDINPWAPRTDPILFSWLELLSMSNPAGLSPSTDNRQEVGEDEPEDVARSPEMRLIGKNDPEARSFNSPKYSAHKMPKDVVDASQAGPGVMQDFATQWKQAMNRQGQRGDSSDDD